MTLSSVALLLLIASPLHAQPAAAKAKARTDSIRADSNTVGKKGDSTFTTSVDGAIEYAFATTTSARTQDGLTIVASVGASTGSASLSRAANLAGTFAPSGGNILSRTAALPSGSLTLSGTMTVIGAVTGNQIPAGGPSRQTISMSVSTAAPLNANIGCSIRCVDQRG